MLNYQLNAQKTITSLSFHFSLIAHHLYTNNAKNYSEFGYLEKYFEENYWNEMLLPCESNLYQ